MNFNDFIISAAIGTFAYWVYGMFEIWRSTRRKP